MSLYTFHRSLRYKEQDYHHILTRNQFKAASSGFYRTKIHGSAQHT